MATLGQLSSTTSEPKFCSTISSGGIYPNAKTKHAVLYIKVILLNVSKVLF